MARLFYVIGASGAGKDTLLNFARARLNGTGNVLFAHRYITRAAGLGNENHVSLSKEEFDFRLALGLFCLHWESHDCSYGIGVEINAWLSGGADVVVNGSRQYLAGALSKYPELIPVIITASDEVIASRLSQRGRENDGEVQKRMARNDRLNTDFGGYLLVENNHTVEEAGNRLLEILCKPDFSPNALTQSALKGYY